MREQIVRIGQIGFLNADSEEEKALKKKNKKSKGGESREDKKEKDKCDLKHQITFDGEKNYLCLLADGDKSKVAFLKDKASYYCLYLKNMEQSAGYYYDEKGDGQIVIVERIDDKTYVVHTAYIDDTLEQELSDITDYHFDGGSAFRIEENYESIKSEYAKDNTKIILIAMAFLIVVVMYFFYVILFEEEAAPPPPPPPIRPPLTALQEAQLKQVASLKIIEDMKKEISSIHEDELRNDGKLRFESFSVGNVAIIAPETPMARPDGTYYYGNPEMIDGGLSIQISKTYQMVYPQEGYALSGEKHFSKSSEESLVLKPSQIDENTSNLFLSKECIEDVIALSPNNTIAYNRTSSLIEFRFKDLKASDFIIKASSIFKKCPAFIKDTTVSNGSFNGNVVLYAKERM